MSTLTNYFRGIWNNLFKRYVSIALAVLAAIMIFVVSPDTAFEEPPPPETDATVEVHFFYHSGCPHCRDQEPFNEEMAAKYPDVYFVYHDGADPAEYDVLVQLIQGTNISEDELDFPATIIGSHAFVGWESREINGPQLEQTIVSYLEGDGESGAPIEEEGLPEELDVPIFGTIKISDYSLPALAVTLGLVDGFNPCAMWVLAYLISLLFVLNDRRKAWLIVGAFVFASFVLNYLFMTAWLNAFLLIGYSGPITVMIGAIALGAGTFNLYDYVKSGGQVVCEVIDSESRKSTMSRIESIVASPISLGVVIAVTALAFVVNSFEFVCSAALPAIFTRVLTIAGLTTVQYYLYIFLYVFFLMLDHLVIFSAAALAINTSLADRYMKYCRPVGGVILLVLGILLVFAPQLLR
ncbi:MAG: thioredoxin family protein [Dehalococcoidia bacterium]|nr:thioredoxin family protein [Dehalococcoidia bacterium]